MAFNGFQHGSAIARASWLLNVVPNIAAENTRHLPALDETNKFVLTHFLLHSLSNHILRSLIGFVFCLFFSFVL